MRLQIEQLPLVFWNAILNSMQVGEMWRSIQALLTLKLQLHLLAYVGKGQVDKIGKELAPSYKKWIGTDKGSADFGWGSFRDVQRGCHWCHSNTKSNKNTSNNEERWAIGSSHDHSSNKEQNVSYEKCRFPSMAIIQPSTNSSSNNCSCNCHAHYSFLYICIATKHS